jgi:hypothetical protein
LIPIILHVFFYFLAVNQIPTKLGLVNQSEKELSLKFVELVKKEKSFLVKEGSELELKDELIAADQTAIIIIPKNFNEFPDPGTLRLLLDASQVRQVGAIRDSLRGATAFY